MNPYWSVVPTRVRKSKRLSSEEKELYYELKERLTPAGYCTDSNAELAKVLNVSEKTISARLAKLVEKKFANVTQNNHKHKRMIYLHIPGVVEEPEKPTDEEIQENVKNFQESLKKAIVFGTVEPKVLIKRFKESPYLDNLEDNSTQFILTLDQVEFLASFMKRYPGKAIDCQLASYENVDYDRLLKAISESEFLMSSNNLSLKWCLFNSAEIINGNYKTTIPQAEIVKPNFKSRDYKSNELLRCFQNINEIKF